MNKIHLFLILTKINCDECPNCGVACQLKNLDAREMLRKYEEGFATRRFELIIKYSSCNTLVKIKEGAHNEIP